MPPDPEYVTELTNHSTWVGTFEGSTSRESRSCSVSSGTFWRGPAPAPTTNRQKAGRCRAVEDSFAMNQSENTMSTTLPTGSWPVMLTPFLEDQSIDWHGVDALTDWYIANGSAGLFAVCLSSEMYQLTDDERTALATRVVRHAAGRVPVVATGTFGGTVEEQARTIVRMRRRGSPRPG